MTDVVTNSTNVNTDNYVWRDVEPYSNNKSEIDFDSQLSIAIESNNSQQHKSDNNNDIPIAQNNLNFISYIIPKNNSFHRKNLKVGKTNHKLNKQTKNLSENKHKEKENLISKNKINLHLINKSQSANKTKISKKAKPETKILNKLFSKKFENNIQKHNEKNPINSIQKLKSKNINNIKSFNLINDKLESKIKLDLNIKSLKIKTIKTDKNKEKTARKIIPAEQSINEINKRKSDFNFQRERKIDSRDSDSKQIEINKNILAVNLKSENKKDAKTKINSKNKEINPFENKNSKEQKFENISRLNNNKTKSKNNILINQSLTKTDKKSYSKTKENNFHNLINSIKTIKTKNDNATNIISNDNTNGYDSSYQIKIENLSKTITNISKNISNNTYHTARLVMQPKSLGTIIVKIIINNNIAKISFDVSSEKAIKNIENQLGFLKINLAQEGIKTEKIEINQQKNDGLNNREQKKKNDNFKENYQVVENFIKSFKKIKD